MEIVAIISLVVAVIAVVWAVRQPAKTENAASSPPDNAALAQHIAAEVKTQVSEAATTALNANNETFLALADEKMKNLQAPLDTQMKKLGTEIEKLEASNKTRKGAVDQLMTSLGTQISELHTTTNTLSTALRSPTYRGSWGEQQLRNVIEMAGMVQYCDFEEQAHGENREGNVVRPDVRVRLPNGAHLAIDAKTPYEHYALAQEATDQETVDLEFKKHAADLKSHVDALASKKYWEHNDGPAPEYVILFVPGESFLADAARARPQLLEEAMKKRVLLASPVNLLALLWAVHQGWQEAKVSESARDVAELGKELYERAGVLIGHFATTGARLKSVVDAFNKLVGSFDSRFMPQLRKFNDLGVGGKELDNPSGIEATPQLPQAEELENSGD
ncbi:MAG: DNA recombination protein RmuC [Acidimicrobiales bacterium]|nr:DNA recombination protein RmuC [Acidimicrobiales bacterium]